MNEAHGHIPVLIDEVLTALAPKPGEVVVDCTVGRGGHSAALAAAVTPGGRVIGFDLDEANCSHAAQRLRTMGADFTAIHDSFVRVAPHLVETGVRADVVVADLGFSSTQMDDAQRGFSFAQDGPLDMRFDTRTTLTAADIVNTWDPRELTEIIGRFGEDPYAPKIARKLVQTRETMPIESTAQLAELVREAYGARARTSRMHPATRTFMALRIAVNDELSALEALLESITHGAEQIASGGWLKDGARVAVISFHSLEDRCVKRAFADLARRDLGTRLTKRPITATDGEISVNPRARSAKLRAAVIGG